MYTIILWSIRQGKFLEIPLVMSRDSKALQDLLHDESFVEDRLLSLSRRGIECGMFVQTLH